MDSVFGIGLAELIAILLIAGIVMGPERIVQAARWLGKYSAKAQGVLQGFVSQLNRELDTVDSTGELRAMIGEMQQQIDGLKSELSRPVVENGKKAAGEGVDADQERVIAPPHIAAATRQTTGLTEFKPGKAAEAAPAYRLTSFPTQKAPAAAGPPTQLSRQSLPSRVHVGDDPDE